MKTPYIVAALAAATTVLAQDVTGMMGKHMSASPVGQVLGPLFFVGLVILVWLWNVKLWKELKKGK
ncbi:hypothetical protein CMO91_04555 [Candidatus Woesearchaeota archaeon]|jgi:hypothetical protein|nr:hypothetical protein [Candidatus Woesearchaeota archaeon]